MASQTDLDQLFMKTALNVAELSHARRLKVGAVLVNSGRIVGTGFNGMPAGMNNVCEVINTPAETLLEITEDTSDDSIANLLEHGAELVTKQEVIHAELNLLLFAAKYGVRTEGCAIYVSHAPCRNCAASIIQAGIKEVFYIEQYRLTVGEELLESAGVSCKQLALIK